jgi:dUTP pyrophosphatase
LEKKKINMLYIKRLTETAEIPERAHPGDAGLDLFADADVSIPEYHRALVHTGLAVAIDPGKVGLIWPRSGLAAKGISVDAGVIDAGYRGEIKVLITNMTPHRITLSRGDKIAQLLIQPVYADTLVEVDSLPASSRGEQGFGSSGQ